MTHNERVWGAYLALTIAELSLAQNAGRHCRPYVDLYNMARDITLEWELQTEQQDEARSPREEIDLEDDSDKWVALDPDSHKEWQREQMIAAERKHELLERMKKEQQNETRLAMEIAREQQGLPPRRIEPK